ncbi:MAG: dihydroorotase [Acidimicrobiales bacterium]|mgnify:FL=1|nr:dihydroorotase [Acidimicrobiales bacterium]HJM37504.1 dihydroorotase [Acidimicrobiales bacterium]|tara:strand:+ start:510 stop:1802 length:1293 start_codon:yes stop_codon:yes gene_type:complete
MNIVLKGGKILDRKGERSLDVSIGPDGKIIDTGKKLEGDREVDCSGCVITSGLVDLHVHLREPGNEEAETIETGARSGAMGGFTALVAMPNTEPATDCLAVVEQIRTLGSKSSCEIIPSAAMTVGREGKEMVQMGELVDSGIGIFTDDGTGVQDPQLMRHLMEYSTGLESRLGRPVVLAQHCEVHELAEGGYMHEGEWSSLLGIPGQPAEAEELMVMRDIALSKMTGARIHFQHLSTSGSVQMVREAKALGLPVTAEATTHHFTLTDSACSCYDPVFKVHPPLRTESDLKAIKEGLADGTIDAIATDHAPHSQHSKEMPFDQAPPGMLGLETALSLSLEYSGLDLPAVLGMLSWQPAKIAGVDDRHGMTVEKGNPANLCVIDLDETWTVSGKQMSSRSSNTPYEGWNLRGRVRHTLNNGLLVVFDGESTK